MAVVLYVGDVTPTAFAMVVTPGDSGLNLSTVTAITFRVKKANGSLTSWATALSAQSSSTVTATYTFASTSPIDIPGQWYAYAELTIPSGTVRTDTETLIVKDKYDIQ